MQITEDERAILNIVADLWNAILALPVLHSEDEHEHRRDIHNIENRIMARAAMRILDAEDVGKP